MSTTRVQSDFSFRTKDGIKRPTVSVEYDAPDVNGVADLLTSSDPKVVALVVETVQGLLTSHIRGFVDADLEFDQAKLDALVADGKVSIEAIANLPKSERSMLTKDDLEAFARDYIAIMPEATGKSVERVTAAAGLFVERYKRAAGDNQVLAVLQEQLATFVEAADEDTLATHARAIDYLANKVAELMSVKVTADAL